MPSLKRQPKPKLKSNRPLPIALRVLGSIYEVHEVPDLIKSEGLHGDCDPHRRVIRVAHDTETAMHNTLLHESLHAAFAESGLTNLISEDIEEAIVQMFERYLENIITLSNNFILKSEIPNAENRDSGTGTTPRTRKRNPPSKRVR